MSCPQLNYNLRAMAIKAETTPGTWIEPDVMDIRFRNIEVSPTLPVDDENSNYGTGDHGEDESLSGAQSGTVSAMVKLAWSGTVTVEPKNWTALKPCGCDVVTYTTTGLGLVGRKSTDCTTYSVAVYDTELGATPVTTIYKFAGCVGNAVIGADGIGAPWQAALSYQGKLYDVVDGTLLALSGNDTTVAETLINNSTTVLGDSSNFLISSFSFDLGNVINPVFAQGDIGSVTSYGTGFDKFVITERRPRLSINPLAVKQASVDWLDDFLTESTGATTISGTNLELTLLKSQLISPAIANREGLVNWDYNLKALRYGTASGQYVAEDTWELLQGARA